jgi:dihydrofolate reductase
MGKVVLDLSISLDGCIAGSSPMDGRLHSWYFDEHPSQVDQQIIADTIVRTGALILGRTVYDLGVQFDGYSNNPYQVPHFVLTHQAPAQLPKGNTSFVYVTDGIQSALNQARTAAGPKEIVIGGGAETARQYLQAGLVDELLLHIVPVLMGSGLPLLRDLHPIPLEIGEVIPSPHVTHIRYRVLPTL